MAEQTMIQFCVDKQLKKDVTEIYEALGMDRITALRMFLNRSGVVGGLPFEAVLPESYLRHKEVMDVYAEIPEEEKNAQNL